MVEPIYFLALILEAFGLPGYGGPNSPSVLAQVLAPYMQYSYLAFFVCIILGVLAVSKMDLVTPKGLQNIMELFVGGVWDFIYEQTGHDQKQAELIFPINATFLFYIMVCNFMGLIPGFACPTSNLNVTLGLTAIAIGSYHLLGLRFHGIKYFKHFLGPILWMAPIMCPIEIFSHIGRIISLSIRLFGNMVSKEILLGLLFMLAGPYLAPLPIMLLGVLVCVLQAFIFFVLSICYATEAMAPAHCDHHE